VELDVTVVALQLNLVAGNSSYNTIWCGPLSLALSELLLCVG